MAYAKNKKRSNNFHNSRVRAKSSHLARSKKIENQTVQGARRTILVVIIMAMLAVILAVFSVYFFNSERVVKQKITDIATDYYENYYYPQLVGTANEKASLEQIMSHYTRAGFARVTLRQLLLFDSGRYSKSASTLTNYCDENTTYIQIFPEPPFGKSDYRIDYHYSCTF